MRLHSMKLLSAVMYILSFLAFFCLVGTDVISIKSVPYVHSVKFMTALLVFIFGYFGAVFRCRIFSDEKASKRVFRHTFFMLFLAYCFIVIDFTLIDDTFGRNVSSIFSLERDEIGRYIKENTNMIPFATIRLFIHGYKSGALSFAVMVENILGNLMVFMPFSLFLPVISDRFYSRRSLIPTIICIVVFIELLQLVMLTGSADIDDFILNVAGAALANVISKTNACGRLLVCFSSGVWKHEAE